MRQRLLADTCSALKLAAFGKTLFQPNTLPKGDLILHSSLFRETGKWPEPRRAKHGQEFKVLAEVRATPGLSNDGRKISAQMSIIEMTREELGLSIGRVDKEILATVLINRDIGLVTNDRALAEVAESGFTVEVVSAEDILIEAVDSGVLSIAEARAGIKRWNETGDGVLTSAVPELRQRGVL